jgi:hypothetical protein
MNHLLPSPLKIALGSFRIFSKICGDIRKSRCQFAAGVNDTGGNFATRITVSTTPAANFPLLSTTWAVHLELRIKPEVEILVALSL